MFRVSFRGLICIEFIFPFHNPIWLFVCHKIPTASTMKPLLSHTNKEILFKTIAFQSSGQIARWLMSRRIDLPQITWALEAETGSTLNLYSLCEFRTSDIIFWTSMSPSGQWVYYTELYKDLEKQHRAGIHCSAWHLVHVKEAPISFLNPYPFQKTVDMA